MDRPQSELEYTGARRMRTRSADEMQYVIAARAAQDEYEIVNLVNHESLVLSTYAVADADSRLPDSPFLRRQVEEEAHGS